MQIIKQLYKRMYEKKRLNNDFVIQYRYFKRIRLRIEP